MSTGYTNTITGLKKLILTTKNTKTQKQNKKQKAKQTNKQTTALFVVAKTTI